MDPNWTMKCCNVCNDKWKAPDPTRHQLGSYVHQNRQTVTLLSTPTPPVEFWDTDRQTDRQTVYMGEELGNYVHQNMGEELGLGNYVHQKIHSVNTNTVSPSSRHLGCSGVPEVV